MLAACSSDEGDGGEDGADLPDAGGETGDDTALFDRDHLLEVEIEMADADWDALRAQTRSVLDILGGNCLAQPFESPFTYFRADLTVDGQTLPQVGLRKKGFLGSLSQEKPSLKVKLDEYVDGQELGGLDKLTFNNSQQDASFLRQCLAYDLFRDAGVPAPRCSFAHLTVNGEDLGLFVHVESLDKQFLEKNFDDPEGLFYEGTLSDFRPEFEGTFDLKTDDVVDDRSHLDALVDALADPDDAGLMDRLEPLVDLDAFATFWAMEVLTRHWDGYASNTNNFYLYDDPTTGRFQFVPWGVDGTFSPNPLLPSGEAPPVSVFATGVLARRLYLHPDGQDDYLARLRELLDSVWDEDAILASLDRYDEVIWPVVGGSQHTAAADEVRSAIRAQRAAIEGELAAGPPAWTAPLRDPLCLDTIGTVDVSFDTTWGTQGAANPFATGTGTWAVRASGDDLTETDVGATAGDDPNAPKVLLQTFAALDDGRFAVVFLQVEPSRYQPGSQEIDWSSTFGGVFIFDPVTLQLTLIGLLGPGTVTIDEAGATASAAVSGHITADLVATPF
jgi:spore coat protein H